MDNIAVGIVNDEFAYHAYSYLLVANGYACLCTVVARDFAKLEPCFEKTREYFVKKYKLKINSSQAVGGVGSFSLNGPYKKGKTLFVGEAAGIQDFLAGFGMRTALTSGYLAAESIVENKDYEKVAREWFGDYLKAGIANRYLWEKAGAGNYVSIFEKIAKKGDPIRFIRSMYNLNSMEEAEYLLVHEEIKKEYPNLDL
jgi:flavin-dependent dehydrogenase